MPNRSGARGRALAGPDGARGLPRARHFEQTGEPHGTTERVRQQAPGKHLGARGAHALEYLEQRCGFVMAEVAGEVLRD